jgi:hypothetical protein
VINMKVTGQVVATFATPKPRTDKVAAALKVFDRVGDSFGALEGDIQDAREGGNAALAEAARANADAHLAGKEPTFNLAELQEAQASKLAALRSGLPAIESAIDEAGNALALAIDDERGAWLAEVDALEAQATDKFDALLAETRQALTELEVLRSEQAWLARWNLADNLHGHNVSPFPGARPIPLDSDVYLRHLDSDAPVDKLLAAAAESVTPARKLVVA